MRRRAWLALALVATPLAVIGACGFPDVTFAPENDGGIRTDGPGSSAQETGSADAGGADVVQDVAALFRDASEDVRIVVDDAGKVDAAGCVTCDCDHDGFNKPDCGIQPVDCDDTDTRVNAGSGFRVDDAEAPWNGDWNCDKTTEPFYANGVDCGGTTLASLLGVGKQCSDLKGFTTTVACGATGLFVQCKKDSNPLTLHCLVDTSNETTVQACR